MRKIKSQNPSLFLRGGASTFCKTVYTMDAVYAVGVAANIWNPVGWIGGSIMLGINGYCTFG